MMVEEAILVHLHVYLTFQALHAYT